jgi:acetylornithine deacetylase/succinyl-diaminopimelate desuccinylase-like protein
MELTAYGAIRPLHSGHYGNWAPVPGQMLARLLTSMKAEDGTVLIDGFYDTAEPISEFERSMLDRIPKVEEQLKQELGLATTEENSTPLYESLLKPSLTIKGLSSGNVGDKARNIIPNKAIASIGMRLVKGNDPDHMQDLVEAHIRKQGWHIVYEEPSMDIRRKYPKIIKVERGQGSKAGKTRMDQPDIKNVIEEVKKFTGDDVVFLPSSGGSNRAYYVIFEILKKPGISVNLVNHDNNQHAADENIRIGNLWYGVELMSVLLTLPR